MKGIQVLNLWDPLYDTLHPQNERDSEPLHPKHIPKHHELFGGRLRTSKRAIIQHSNCIIRLNEVVLKGVKQKAEVLRCVTCHAHIVSIWIGCI